MCILHHPHPSTCVSKGSGHISDGCGTDAEKGEWRLGLAVLKLGHLSLVVTSVLSFPHCTLGTNGICTLLVMIPRRTKTRQSNEENKNPFEKFTSSFWLMYCSLRFLSTCTNVLTRWALASMVALDPLLQMAISLHTSLSM